jgi:alpha-beta hydrolase superfamily lysophospholipase
MAAAIAETKSMIEEPFLLPTSRGPIAAVLGLPDDEPRAAVMVVQGFFGTRAGLNQTWSRLARALNEEGIATLRSDYSGLGESWDADPLERIAGVRALAEWFEERTPGVPLLVVAHCYGLAPAAALARDDPRVVGAAVLSPPFFPAYESRGALSVASARRIVLRRVRQLPRRLAYRARYGPATRIDFARMEGNHPSVDLENLVANTPTWILVGSKDSCTEPVRELLPLLQTKGHVELEVVEGMALHGAADAGAQRIILDGMRAWVRRCVETAESGV